jgi:type IV pilus assembly protein PilV
MMKFIGSYPFANERRCLQRQKGFSIVEVLIALLISAVAIMQLVSHQFSDLGYSKKNNERAMATVAAADLFEKMRANASALSDYIITMDNPPTSAPTKLCDGASSCSAAERAETDLWLFQGELRNSFSEAAGFSANYDATKKLMTVMIRWPGNDGGRDGVACVDGFDCVAFSAVMFDGGEEDDEDDE